jgi:hypothetical protein
MPSKKPDGQQVSRAHNLPLPHHEDLIGQWIDNDLVQRTDPMLSPQRLHVVVELRAALLPLSLDWAIDSHSFGSESLLSVAIASLYVK